MGSHRNQSDHGAAMPAIAWGATLGLLFNAFVFGVSWWPFRELQAAGLHPLWATALSFVCVALCLGLFVKGVVKSFISHRALWLLALASGTTNVAFNWAVTVGDVVRVVLLFYLMPAWSLLLARYLLAEPISRKALLRLGVAVTGVVLVLYNPAHDFSIPRSLPDWLAILGGMSFALTNVWLRRMATQAVSPPESSRVFAMFLGTSVTSLVTLYAATHTGLIAVWHPSQLWGQAASSTLILGVLGLALAFWLGNLGMQYGASRLKASISSLIMLSEIVFATLSSVFLGAASLTWPVICGGFLIGACALWAALD
jgi:drug/metabolite transporter (DMT)-like permease